MEIKVLVKTGKKNQLHDYDKEKDAYPLDISAPPEKGKANIEIVKFLTRHFKKKVRIKSGLTSRRKVIVIEDR